MEFSLIYFFTNKKELCSNYKNMVNKDLTYNHIKNRIELKNTNYYTLFYCYKEILTSILEADNISILEVFQSSSLSQEELEVLETIFENSNQTEEYVKYMKGLSTVPEYYNEFCSEFFDMLLEAFKNQ